MLRTHQNLGGVGPSLTENTTPTWGVHKHVSYMRYIELSTPIRSKDTILFQMHRIRNNSRSDIFGNLKKINELPYHYEI